LQGHPRTVFRRALEPENLLVVEATTREIGHVSLAEALELTALIAEKEPSWHGPFAVRWLRRYLQEQHPIIEEIALLTRRATQVIVSRDLAAYACGKLTARRASPG
jgi:hypothetical protein